MNWKFNPRTGTMEMQKRTGINVSARQGGIMVEDYDRHLQFLINYGRSRITHCVGCRADDLHLFDDRKANEIANKVKRIGIGKGIDESMFDFRTYSIAHKNDKYKYNSNKKDDMTTNENLKWLSNAGMSVSAKYKNYIEEKLDELMPDFEPIYEGNDAERKEANAKFKELHVKDAPKVKGYFKMISIRYMKRVEDIKDMCIEYINTYIDSCLNVAKKMVDEEGGELKLIDGQDSLAKSMNFKKAGVSTNGQEKEADTLKGVLFLTGDKALQDKLTAILKKIRLRAQKSESLLEWADLMIEQSKIISNEIVFEECNKMIKDESKRKDVKKEFSEVKKQHEENMANIETEMKQKEKNSKITNGPVDDYAKQEVDQKELEAAKNVKKDDLSVEPVQDGKLPKDAKTEDGGKSHFTELILTWTAKHGMPPQVVFDTYEKTLENKAKANDGEYSNEEKQFLFGAIWADNMNVDKKEIPAPEYICYICANSKKLKQALSKETLTDSEYVELDSYAIDNLDGDALLANSGAIKDANAFYVKAGTEWKYFFSKKYSEVQDKPEKSNESRNYVLSSEEFINEKYFNRY